GILAAHVAKGMARDGHLVCVEGNPDLIPALTRTMTSHSDKLKIDIVHAAIDYRDSTAPFRIGAESVSSRVTDSSKDQLTVPAITLQRLLGEFGVQEPYALVSDI